MTNATNMDYLNRMNRILTNRVEQVKARTMPRFLAVRALLTGMSGALVYLFLLKGAAIAQGDPMLPMEILGGTEAWSAWLLGADPLSQSVAQVLRGTTHL